MKASPECLSQLGDSGDKAALERRLMQEIARRELAEQALTSQRRDEQ